MNKFLAITIIIAVVFSLGTGCIRRPAPQEPAPEEDAKTMFKNGVYTAQEEDYDDHGWKAVSTVVVIGGKITDVFYDEVNTEGKIKSLDQDYAASMKEKSGETPLSAAKKLADQLIDLQNPEKVESISGATGTSTKFKNLVKEALETGPDEKNGKVYYDGIFKAEEEEYDDHGYKGIAIAIIQNGRITNAYFDEMQKDTGSLKNYDEEYAARMQNKSGETPRSAVTKLVNSLIEKQDPEEVDTVSGATGTSTKFKNLMQEALSAAE